MSQILFKNFLATHSSTPALQELPLTVLAAVNSFIAQHPKFPYPENFPSLVGLVAHIEDFITVPSIQGKPFGFSYLLYTD